MLQWFYQKVSLSGISTTFRLFLGMTARRQYDFLMLVCSDFFLLASSFTIFSLTKGWQKEQSPVYWSIVLVYSILYFLSHTHFVSFKMTSYCGIKIQMHLINSGYRKGKKRVVVLFWTWISSQLFQAAVRLKNCIVFFRNIGRIFTIYF